jgi:hypothetical protein
MKITASLLSLTLAWVFLACGGDDVPIKDAPFTEDINLAQSLQTPGKVFSMNSDPAGMTGVVLDTDSDGTGDGIDVSGDGQPNMIYGALDSGKTRANRVTTFAFSFSNSSTQFYFYLMDEGTDKLGFTTNPQGPPPVLIFTLDTETNTILGIDEDGDGSADQDILNGIEYFAFSSEYGGTCHYTEGNLEQCYEFSGAAYNQADSQSFCEDAFGASNISFSTDPCPASLGSCLVTQNVTGAGGENVNYTHTQHYYGPDNSDLETWCNENGFEWSSN